MAGGGSQVSTQKSDPWGPAQPYLKDVLGQAPALYGQGAEYAPFSTTVPFSPQTENALQLTEQRALNGSPLVNQAQGALGNFLSPGLPGMDVLSRVAGGQVTNPNVGALAGMVANGPGTAGQDILSRAASGGLQNANAGALGQYANPNGATPASQYLGSVASGGFLNSNPYIDQVYDTAAGKVRDLTNSTFEKSGRVGSGAHTGVLSENLGNLASQIYGDNYARERGLMQDAAGQIQNAYDNSQGRGLSAATTQAGLGENDIMRRIGAAQSLSDIGARDYATRLGGATSLAGFGQNDVANQTGAAQTLGGLGLNAAGMAPSLANYDYTNLQNLAGVGAQREAKANETVQDLLARWNFQQNAPWDLLNRYNAVVQGFGGLGGTQTGTAPKPDQTGQILQGLGSLAMGAAMFSDERVKTNIRRVGKTDSGLPIYTFNYVWGGPRQMGVMAQDVEKVNPSAVGHLDGIKTVDYAKVA